MIGVLACTYRIHQQWADIRDIHKALVAIHVKHPWWETAKTCSELTMRNMSRACRRTIIHQHKNRYIISVVIRGTIKRFPMETINGPIPISPRRAGRLAQKSFTETDVIPYLPFEILYLWIEQYWYDMVRDDYVIVHINKRVYAFG